MCGLTTGQLAKRARVNIETIRYYERVGMIAEPSRRESGYRQYSEDAVMRILFIKRAQELGFPLKEISELLSLQVTPGATCDDVKKQAAIKLVDIEEKIEDLRKMKQALDGLIAQCPGDRPASECPLLDALTRKRSDAIN